MLYWRFEHPRLPGPAGFDLLASSQLSVQGPPTFCMRCATFLAWSVHTLFNDRLLYFEAYVEGSTRLPGPAGFDLLASPQLSVEGALSLCLSFRRTNVVSLGSFPLHS